MFKFGEKRKKKALVTETLISFAEIKDKLVADSNVWKAYNRTEQKLNSAKELLVQCDSELLRKIISYIKQTPNKEYGATTYLERIAYLLDEYILVGKKYDIEKELKNDNQCELECKAINYKVVAMDYQAKMKQLTEYVTDCNIQKGTIEYKDINRKYESFSIEYHNAMDSWNDAVNTLLMNQKSSAVLRMREELLENSKYVDKSFEEFQDIVEETKLLRQQKNAEVKAYNEAFNQFSETSIVGIDTYNLDKAVEETMLEKLAKEYKDEQDFEKVLSNKSSAELLNAIARLQEKLEVQANNTPQDDKMQSLIDLMQKVYYQVYLDKDVGGDIEKSVMYALSSNPKDLQSASLKLRACIENYCRYNKGVELTDKFLFDNNQKVIEKLKIAGFDDATASMLENIYCSTNPYIHNAVEELKDPDLREKEIIKAAKTLKRIGLDKYDVVTGMQKFYMAQDQLLATRIKESTNPTEYTSTYLNNGKCKFDNPSLFYIKEAQLKRYNYMQRNGIAIPHCNFDGSSDENFMNSVQNFVNTITSNHTDVSQQTEQVKEVASTNAQPTQSIRKVVLSADGNTKQELNTGKVLCYYKDKKFGFIEHPQFDKGIYFGIRDVEDDECNIKVGVVVEYTIGQNAVGPVAKNVKVK